MSRWQTSSLAARDKPLGGLVVVFDPDRVFSAESAPMEVVTVEDWWQLRAAYERTGRRRRPDDRPLLLHLRGDLAQRPLPWDIEHASTTVDLGLPGPPAVRRALAELADVDFDDHFDQAVDAVEAAIANRVDPVRALLEAVTGLDLSAPILALTAQLRLATRLAAMRKSGYGTGLIGLAASLLVAALAALIADSPDPAPFQTAWQEAVEGVESQWSQAFRDCQPELSELFALGLLERSLAHDLTPPWASVGTRQPTIDEHVEALMAQRPGSMPTEADGWCSLAEWWGQLRYAAATATSSLRDEAWSVWGRIDEAFEPWLRARYGTLLFSSKAWPPALHRVAPFLRRRLQEGRCERVLLLVLDGLGHTQWSRIQSAGVLKVEESGSTFAMIPTYTTVSRQAIFAGDLPRTFPGSLWDTSPEPAHWRRFWQSHGLGVTGSMYRRVNGHFPQDLIDFGAARAAAVVINAVDILMHSSELLGDAQLHAGLDAWLANGFLAELISSACAAGFEVWLTADHGNLECLPAGVVKEGLGIEAGGKRLIRYPNATLRDASAAPGIVWDPIPGMPDDEAWLRFAPARLAYTRFALSVSHGGLSIDEVIVPLARVSAP